MTAPSAPMAVLQPRQLLRARIELLLMPCQLGAQITPKPQFRPAIRTVRQPSTQYRADHRPPTLRRANAHPCLRRRCSSFLRGPFAQLRHARPPCVPCREWGRPRRTHLHPVSPTAVVLNDVVPDLVHRSPLMSSLFGSKPPA